MVWPNLETTNACGVRGLAFLRAWREEGADVAIIAHPPTGGGAIPAEADARVVRLFHDKADLWRLPWSDARLDREIRRHKPDVVVASTPAVTVGWQAARAAARARVPFVADVRDLSVEGLRAANGDRLAYRLLDRMEREVFARAAAVTPVSDIMGDDLVSRYGVPRGKIHVVPNGHTFGDAEPSNVAKDIDAILVDTDLDASRRPLEVVDAYARVKREKPDAVFAFLGWRDDLPMSGPVKAKIAALGLAGSVRLLPRVERAEVRATLERSRVGILSLANHPAYRSAVGAKTYEYLALGLPVCVLGLPGDSEARRLVEGAGVGLFASDPDAFADHLTKLIANDAYRERLGRKAREVAKAFDRGSLARRALVEAIAPLARR